MVRMVKSVVLPVFTLYTNGWNNSKDDSIFNATGKHLEEHFLHSTTGSGLIQHTA